MAATKKCREADAGNEGEKGEEANKNDPHTRHWPDLFFDYCEKPVTRRSSCLIGARLVANMQVGSIFLLV